MSLLQSPARAWRFYRKNGLHATIKRAHRAIFGGIKWKDPYTPQMLEEQRATVFSKPPIISLLVPLYKTLP